MEHSPWLFTRLTNVSKARTPVSPPRSQTVGVKFEGERRRPVTERGGALAHDPAAVAGRDGVDGAFRGLLLDLVHSGALREDLVLRELRTHREELGVLRTGRVEDRERQLVPAIHATAKAIHLEKRTKKKKFKNLN